MRAVNIDGTFQGPAGDLCLVVFIEREIVPSEHIVTLYLKRIVSHCIVRLREVNVNVEVTLDRSSSRAQVNGRHTAGCVPVQARDVDLRNIIDVSLDEGTLEEAR